MTKKTKKPTRKQQLQAMATARGIDYPAKATIADLEAMLEPQTTTTSRSQDACPLCGRPGGSNHVHTNLGKETNT